MQEDSHLYESMNYNTISTKENSECNLGLYMIYPAY